LRNRAKDRKWTKILSLRIIKKAKETILRGDCAPTSRQFDKETVKKNGSTAADLVTKAAVTKEVTTVNRSLCRENPPQNWGGGVRNYEGVNLSRSTAGPVAFRAVSSMICFFAWGLQCEPNCEPVRHEPFFCS
jgi:hypothetical protein